MRRAFISGTPVTEGGEAGTGRWLVFLLAILIFSFSLASLYMGMRGVMRLGGFVAKGGPYEIAHPAPDYVWIFPVSIFLLIISMFMSFFSSSKVGGPNLMALSWSALFIALGWNFTEFGFGIGMGGRLAWGWIICAVLFMLMGIIPLLAILGSFHKSVQERMGDPSKLGTGPSWTFSLLAQGIVAASGVLLGLSFFRVIS